MPELQVQAAQEFRGVARVGRETRPERATTLHACCACLCARAAGASSSVIPGQGCDSARGRRRRKPERASGDELQDEVPRGAHSAAACVRGLPVNLRSGMARRGLVSSAAAFAAIGCLCLVATLTQRSGGGVELKSRRGRGSDDDQLLDASGQPFHWGPDDHAGGGRARRSSKTAKIHNGVRYASGMPWAKRDHWSAAETSDTSPGSLHHRLVREGAHDTASGVQSLCNRLTSGGDSTADDPGSTIHTHMHACVCMQACRCTYMCMCACAGALLR